MSIGIYSIYNIVNKKTYIGSSINIEKRWIFHKKDLFQNKHHNYKIQDDFNRYGIKKFSFQILEIVENKKKLLETEQLYIDIFSKKRENLYNITTSAEFSNAYLFNDFLKKNKKTTKKQEKVIYFDPNQISFDLQKKILLLPRKIAVKRFLITQRCYELLKLNNS